MRCLAWLISLFRPKPPPPEHRPNHVDPPVIVNRPSEPEPAMISTKHQHTIYQILSVFETGKTEPAYGSAHVLPDGAGITYGKHQSTDRSDSLDAILEEYAARGGIHATELEPYLPWLAENGTAKEDPENLSQRCKDLIAVLHRTGDDPIMHVVQDAVFEKLYWKPAYDQFKAMELTLPLSMLVCYDSTIHSGNTGISKIRKLFPESPPSNGGDEHQWVIAYLEARRKWLLGIPHAAFTVYRIDAMIDMVKEGNWQLDTPLQIAKPRATID